MFYKSNFSLASSQNLIKATANVISVLTNLAKLFLIFTQISVLFFRLGGRLNINNIYLRCKQILNSFLF